MRYLATIAETGRKTVMARFSVLVFALVMVFSSADGWAKDKKGGYADDGNPSCGYYLDAYSKTTLKGDGYLEGPHEALSVFGWINCYLTAYNQLSNMSGTPSRP